MLCLSRGRHFPKLTIAVGTRQDRGHKVRILCLLLFRFIHSFVILEVPIPFSFLPSSGGLAFYLLLASVLCVSI